MTYVQEFANRGSAYDRAMSRWPEARRQEFEQALKPLNLTAGMVLADVPAGGGYLKRFVPEGCQWRGHEPCSSFTRHGEWSSVPLLPLPWDSHQMDVAVSLAGIHHLMDKVPLFADLYRVVKPGGQLVVSDVAQDSAVARFLDEFVGLHNSTGHQGFFLSQQTLDELQAAQWQLQSVEERHFHWLFDDRVQMAQFCHQLFDLVACDIDHTGAAI